MEQKKEKSNFTKVFVTFFGIVLLLTFFSKSIYNYQLPVVTISLPKQGKLNFTVEDTAEISYSHVDSIYAASDGRVKKIMVQAGDEVRKGQCLMKFEVAETGKIKDIVAGDNGIITSVGVKKGMYVSYMQNMVLYEMAEKSKEWTVTVFVTDEQLEYVNTESIVNVQVEDLNESYKGKIQSVVSYANQSKNGYQAEITIISENTEIAGKKAKVTIEKESEQYDAIIPVAALRKDSVGYYVLIPKKEDSVLGNGYVANRVSVDLLNSDETYCAVRGLPKDESVIVASTSEITEGSKVYYEGNGTE